jgi:hypothetical protein
VRRRHLESQVIIQRPVDDVWAFMIDLFKAPPDAILVTSTVRDLVVGSGFVFEPAGRWRLYEVMHKGSVDDFLISPRGQSAVG